MYSKLPGADAGSALPAADETDDVCRAFEKQKLALTREILVLPAEVLKRIHPVVEPARTSVEPSTQQLDELLFFLIRQISRTFEPAEQVGVG